MYSSLNYCDSATCGQALRVNRPLLAWKSSHEKPQVQGEESVPAATLAVLC